MRDNHQVNLFLRFLLWERGGIALPLNHRVPCTHVVVLQTYADDVSSYSSIQGLTFEEDARCSKCDVPLIANCNFCQNCGTKVNIDGAFASRREFQSGYT